MNIEISDLAEAMALAVLRGDRIAAYALADKLVNESKGERERIVEEAIRLRNKTHRTGGIEVFHWPEFIAFCRRAGILWDLRTIGMVIEIHIDKSLNIIQEYRGSDNQ